MNDNYLIYNKLGVLINSELNQVSQGNHNVDYYYVGYNDYDYTTSYVTIAITLPNQVELPEISTSLKDFEFDGVKYKGFMFKLTETLTAIAGNLTMTFYLKSLENDTLLCSSQLNLLIHETDTPVEPTISTAQYDYLLESIREDFAEIDEKIESGALKGDKGDTGPRGEQGPIGPQGPKGESGDYPELNDKPKINDVELNGNKSFEDLGFKPLTNSEIEKIMK